MIYQVEVECPEPTRHFKTLAEARTEAEFLAEEDRPEGQKIRIFQLDPETLDRTLIETM